MHGASVLTPHQTLTVFATLGLLETLFHSAVVTQLICSGNVMGSLTFDGSVTSDRQCVNITILDDDENESPSIFGSSLEIFQVRLNISELNDAVQLGIQTAFVSIEDDDCKFQQKQLQVPIFCLKC